MTNPTLALMDYLRNMQLEPEDFLREGVRNGRA